jgi:hypothetical protein
MAMAQGSAHAELKFSATINFAVCHYVLETKEVSDGQRKSRRTYLIENKMVSQFLAAKCMEKTGRKMTSIFAKLLKTNVEKMPDFGLAMMLMKTSKL